MTRAELIERVSQKARMSRLRAEMLVEAIFDSLEQSLRRAERIDVRGFGTFNIRQYKPYVGRNPRTGQAVAVEAKRLPYFKASKGLAARVNEGRGDKARAASTSPVPTQGVLQATVSALSG